MKPVNRKKVRNTTVVFPNQIAQYEINEYRVIKLIEISSVRNDVQKTSSVQNIKAT